MYVFLKMLGALILFVSYIVVSLFVFYLLWLTMHALQKYVHG